MDRGEQFRSTHQVEREAPQHRALARAGCAREEQRPLALQQPVVERNGRRFQRLARRSAEVGGFPAIAVLVELPSIVILPTHVGRPVLGLQRRHEQRIGRIDIGDDEALADVARIRPRRVNVQPRVELLTSSLVDLRQPCPQCNHALHFQGPFSGSPRHRRRRRQRASSARRSRRRSPDGTLASR